MKAFGSNDNPAISNFAEVVATGREYRVAFVKADGTWDVAETFMAMTREDANAYAERNYAGAEWYVLDDKGRNINGGLQ
jgi:hypothetical protein